VPVVPAVKPVQGVMRMEINDNAPNNSKHPRRPRMGEPGSTREFMREPITVRKTKAAGDDAGFRIARRGVTNMTGAAGDERKRQSRERIASHE
jgi:hypothetical protein